MSFSVGMKVTMIKPGGWLLLDGEAGPAFGAVYTVRAVRHDGLRLHEVRNRPIRGRWWWPIKVEGYFCAGAFRPVVEPKVELPESLTALLDPANHKTFEPVAKPKSVA